MTILEGSANWGMSAETIIKHIALGEISNLRIEDNIILLPDIPKPHFTTLKKPIYVYREILSAAQKGEYIDERILHITKEEFRAYIQNLVNENYISTIHSEINSSMDYVLTMKGTNYKENKKELQVFLAEKINISIGLINNVL